MHSLRSCGFTDQLLQPRGTETAAAVRETERGGLTQKDQQAQTHDGHMMTTTLWVKIWD